MFARDGHRLSLNGSRSNRPSVNDSKKSLFLIFPNVELLQNSKLLAKEEYIFRSGCVTFASALTGGHRLSLTEVDRIDRRGEAVKSLGIFLRVLNGTF